MTDLLRPAARRTSDPGPHGARSPVVRAALAGLVGSGSVLLLTSALALAGWFAADAGRYGDTRDAVRVGVDAWLLAHGAQLRLDDATVTVIPLGITLLCAYAAYRAGLRAGSVVEDVGSVFRAASVMSAGYGLVGLVAAVLAAHDRAGASPPLAFLGAGTVALIGGAAGILVGSEQGRSLRRALPAWARRDWAPVVLTGAATTLLLLLAAAALLLAGSLVVDFGEAASVLSRLHLDGPGGLMYTLVGIAFVPNALLLAGGYLLGPGFAVGTGTLVSPTAVVLGPVPAFPLLAALPADGATPAWTTWLIALPVLLAASAARLAGRLHPTDRYDVGAGRGLATGVVAALGFTALAVLAGGSVGPGRMAHIGVEVASTGAAAAVALGAGGLVGGLLATWTTRRTSARMSTAGTGAD